MDELKKIVSLFIKQPAEMIGNDTRIDRTSIQGSILIHRMYAEISKIGYPINDYSDIKTFGQLINHINPDSKLEPAIVNDNILENDFSNKLNIGLDIENISNFRATDDYREEEFYKQNFSGTEIAYCLLQSNPLQSFAGKFAAKEALIKCNNKLKSIPFNQIEILNKPNGQPYYRNYAISISHSGDIAIAFAAQNFDPVEEKNQGFDPLKKRARAFDYFSIISLIISLSVLIFCLLNH
jgi:phosphopantetheine--protein transferase-like protein